MTDPVARLYGFTQQDYWHFLHYDPDTGLFVWKPRSGNVSFNSRHAGKPAMTTLDSKGYFKGCLFYRNVWAHRAAHFMAHGEHIPHDIDHINGVRTDNRIENLRAVTVAENRRNAARRSDNTSGATGVSWMKTKQRWRARFYANGGEEHHIGLFHCKEEAERVLRDYRAAHGYHDNHGRTPVEES
jgi:hypothetical protein